MREKVRCIELAPTTFLRVPECYGKPSNTSKCQVCTAGRYCREGVLQIEKEVEKYEAL